MAFPQPALALSAVETIRMVRARLLVARRRRLRHGGDRGGALQTENYRPCGIKAWRDQRVIAVRLRRRRNLLASPARSEPERMSSGDRRRAMAVRRVERRIWRGQDLFS